MIFVYLYFITGFIASLYLMSGVIKEAWDDEDYFFLFLPIMGGVVLSFLAPVVVVLAKIKLIRSLLPQGKIYVIYRNPDYILMPEDKIVTEKEIEELATEGFLSSLPPLEIKRQGKEPVCLQLVIPFSIENKIHNLRISNCKIIEEEQKDKLK